MTGLESRGFGFGRDWLWSGLAKGAMVEGAGTEEPEILRGDRQGLKPDYELDALRGAEAPLFHFRADLLLGRGTSKSPPCRGKRDEDGASIGVVMLSSVLRSG